MQELLHALRIKGRATVPELCTTLELDCASLTRELNRLVEDGLAIERTTGRRPGWMLTEAGRSRHAAAASATADQSTLDALADEYRTFLEHNATVKTACARWQTATDDDTRFDVLEDLHDALEAVAPALANAGRLIARFGRYPRRLEAALERVRDDRRYVTSPLVDSFHTIWFECHEDFLVTLGRTREQEGSA